MLNLTTATSIKFLMRQQGSLASPKVSAAAVFVDKTNGVVAYTWVAANTDTIGTFDAEWEITWNDGGVSTHPREGYITVSIQDDLG